MKSFTVFSLSIIPFSWHVGYWNKAGKRILAIGPVRLSYNVTCSEWKKNTVTVTGTRPMWCPECGGINGHDIFCGQKNQ